MGASAWVSSAAVAHSVAAHSTKFVSSLHLLSGQVTHITAWAFWMFKDAQEESRHLFQRDTC